MPDAPITVARHSGPLDALAADWTALVDERHPGAAFRSFPWISAWWKHHSTSGDPHVLVAREGDRVIGLLALYAEPTALGGRRLRFMADGIVGTDYQGAIARAEDTERVSRAFAAHLASSGADEVLLDDLADDDPLARSIAGDVSARFVCPHVRIAGSFDAYLKSLPDGIGAQYHRRRRWLEKQDGFRIEELRAPDEIARGMSVLWELHRQRWALEGGSDAIDGARVEQFHLDAARGLAMYGMARLYILYVSYIPRAALYGFRHGDRFAFYQSGHEPAWRPRSVGSVLLGDVLRRAFDERLVEFDFLRGSEEYKLKWANGRRETVRVRARGAGLRPWIVDGTRRMEEQARALVKRALPPAAIDWLRARRKQLATLTGGAR